MRLTRRSFLFMTAMALPVAACAPQAPAPAAKEPAKDASQAAPAAKTEAKPVAKSEGRITVVTGVESVNLDPHNGISISNPERNVAQQVMEYLVVRDKEMKQVPMLATEWRTVDELTWEFKLRQGVNFHNGEPFSSAAVKYTVERAQQVNKQEQFHQNVFLDRVETPDDHTVRFVTKRPAGSMLSRLNQLSIIPPKYYSEASAEQAATRPVGTGPYRFVDWQKGDKITLEANESYWGGPPPARTITFRAVPESGARINELLSGGADVISNVPPDQAKSVETSNTRLSPVQGFRKIFIGIRQQDNPALKRVEVRQALNHAVDFDTIAQSLLGGYGQRHGSWTGAPNQINPDLKPYAYDPERAKQLLAEGGFPNGFETTLQTPTGRYNKDNEIAQAIGDYLTKVGVRTTVQPTEFAVHSKSVSDKTTKDLFLLGLGTYAEPIQQLDWLSKQYSLNATFWENDEFERLLDEARTTIDEKKQLEVLHRAEAIAFKEAPVIFLYMQYDFSGVSTKLDFETRPDEMVFFKDVRFK
jgi:peptide/nickel transport system substrate-binding protein